MFAYILPTVVPFCIRRSLGSIVNEIVTAIHHMQFIPPDDSRIQDIMHTAHQPRSTGFGGPHTGVLPDGTSLIHAILKRRKLSKPLCSIQEDKISGEICIKSSFDELGSISLSKADNDR